MFALTDQKKNLQQNVTGLLTLTLDAPSKEKILALSVAVLSQLLLKALGGGTSNNRSSVTDDGFPT